jgi:MinD-like ATPase involved in chromosome partitioning or flagellar assembly
MRDRFVLLGLAHARADWFRSVAQWATAGAVPADFVPCVSAEELRAQLASGRPFSAALLDAALPGTDRDLIATARHHGCPVIVVTGGNGRTDWPALGAAATVPSDLTREHLVDALATHAVLLRGGDEIGQRDEVVSLPVTFGRVVAVTGPGGTGASTAAVALAQQLAVEEEDAAVLLADLALRADQAMLNDVRDIVPGIQELVEAHRVRQLSPAELAGLTFSIEPRGFDLLLGLRRTRYWSSVPRRAFTAAFASLQQAYDHVVCDVTADFEGEDQGGSADVEDRNVMARTAVLAADAVVVVSLPTMKGLHALVRVIAEAVDIGVAADRVLPVVNEGPRQPGARAEISAAVAELLPPAARTLASPVFLPRRNVDAAFRDLSPLPSGLGTVLTRAVDALVSRQQRRPAPAELRPTRVVPGSLGSWADEEVV